MNPNTIIIVLSVLAALAFFLVGWIALRTNRQLLDENRKLSSRLASFSFAAGERKTALDHAAQERASPPNGYQPLTDLAIRRMIDASKTSGERSPGQANRSYQDRDGIRYYSDGTKARLDGRPFPEDLEPHRKMGAGA